MNEPKFRAWEPDVKYMNDQVRVTWNRFGSNELFVEVTEAFGWKEIDSKYLMEYSGYCDEENLDEIWESDLLEIESPRGKFIAEIVKDHGTMGMVAVKGCIVDYFTDHWNDHFMPLIDLYWNENGDDSCLPKSKRLGSKFENLELLSGVEK